MLLLSTCVANQALRQVLREAVCHRSEFTSASTYRR